MFESAESVRPGQVFEYDGIIDRFPCSERIQNIGLTPEATATRTTTTTTTTSVNAAKISTRQKDEWTRVKSSLENAAPWIH